MRYSANKKCASCKQKKNISRNSSFEIPIYNLTENKNNFYRTYYQNFYNKKNNDKTLYPFDSICVNENKIDKYSEVIPPSIEEINLLKMKIKLYKDKLTQLLYGIKKWKNILDKKINNLENIFSSLKINDFILNYDVNEKKIQNIIIFKEIYLLFNSKGNPSDKGTNEYMKNNEYLKYYQQKELSENLLENLIINKNDFIKNGIEIIKYLFEIKFKNDNFKDNKENNCNINENLNNSIKSLEINISTLKEKKLNKNKIKIDNKNFNDEINNSFFSVNNSFNTYNSFNSLPFNSVSSYFNNDKKEIKYKILYSKKLANNIKTKKTISNLNQSANIKPKKLLLLKNNNNIENSQIKKKIPNKILLNQNYYLNNINNYFSYKNKKAKEIKYFVHKKFMKNNTFELNDSNNIDKYIKSEIPEIKKLKNNILIFNKFEENENHISDNNYNLGDEKDISIRIIKTTPEKKFIINPNKPLYIGLNLDNSNCQISILDQNTNDIQLICFKKDIYDIPTLIYLDEKNEDIKIGHEAQFLSNNNPNQLIFNLIKLFGKNYEDLFEQKKFWPFQLYKETNGRIFIKINCFGKKNKTFYIENLLILYIEKLFKLLFSKIIIEEDEIKEKNKNNLIILNININVTIPSYFSYIKRKVLEKIFQKHIFQKLNINNNNCELININYNTVSGSSSKQSTASTINYINNSNHKKNKNKNIEINLNNIKIENSPNPSVLCLQSNNIEESFSSYFSFQSCSKENNILILNITGDLTSIAINSITNEKKDNISKERCQYIKKYQVKNISYLNFGEEDFINNYLIYSLKKIDSNIYNNIINSPNDFIIMKNIFAKNINLLEENTQIEINISKYFYNYNFKILLKREEYFNSNIDLFNKIISLIKNLLYQSKISEINIDDIILIGHISKCNDMKKILSEFFKKNKIIYNKLLENNFENDDFYLVSGAALESMNNNIKPNLKKYIFKDICPISFGIENYIGEVDIIIKKGNKIPENKKNYVKIYKNKNSDFVEIKICEVNNENKKVILSCSNINYKKLKLFNEPEKDFIELLFEFELDENLNLTVFILDKKTFKKKFGFSINIDIIKE